MKILPIEASDQEILDAVREWVGLLVTERYADACAFLHQREDIDIGHHWTPEQMSDLIRNHGSSMPRPNGEIFKVTSLEDAKADPPRYLPPHHDVERYRDDPQGSVYLIEGGKMTEIPLRDRVRRNDYVGYVWFDLPLNGYWSDLTATFDIRIWNNQIVLQLIDIHVM